MCVYMHMYVCEYMCVCLYIHIYIHIYDFLKLGQPFSIIFASITNFRQAYSGGEKENNGKFKLQCDLFFFYLQLSHISVDTSMFPCV